MLGGRVVEKKIVKIEKGKHGGYYVYVPKIVGEKRRALRIVGVGENGTPYLVLIPLADGDVESGIKLCVESCVRFCVRIGGEKGFCERLCS